METGLTRLNFFVASLKMEYEVPHNETNSFRAIFSLFTKKTLRLMPSIVVVVIVVHTVILWIFVAVASWKLVSLEKAIEEQKPSK